MYNLPLHILEYSINRERDLLLFKYGSHGLGIAYLRFEFMIHLLDIQGIYFMLSGRISRNIGENIFRSYTGTTSENTDFHALVA